MKVSHLDRVPPGLARWACVLVRWGIPLLKGSSIPERLNPQPMTLALCCLARRPKYGYPCQGEAVTVVPWGSRCKG
jgi:hypothetical protein